MNFVNGFLSYFVLMLIFVLVGGIAIFLGISMRKVSNGKAENVAVESANTETQSEK